MQSVMFTLFNLLLDVRARVEDLQQKERGATAVEYGLLVALIAAVIVVVVTTLGTNIRTAFCTVVTATGGGACT